MARSTNGSSTYLLAGDQTPLRVAFPLSISMWWRGNSPGAFDYLLSKVAFAGSHASYSFSVNSDQDLRFIIGWGLGANEFTQSNVIANTSFFNDVWHHVVGVYDGSNIYIHFDGVSTTTGVTETRAIAYSSAGLTVGSFDGTQLYAPGNVAELAMWNASLSLGDAYSMAKGFSPRMIRPDKLVAYWPLIGRGTTEPDLRNGMNFTNFSTDQSAHPRIITPSSDQIRRYSTPVVAPQTKGKQFMPFFGP